jgi:peptide deformylase
MLELKPVIQLGNPRLREKSPLVENIQNSEIQKLIDDLITTVIKTDGVGIAAPQLGENHRLFIVASRPNPRYPEAPEMEPMAMINPRITAHTSPVVKGWEGCLSIPGIRGLVPRYESIDIEYNDRYGQLQKQKLTGFVARIFQHEYDHLDGIVFLDRVETTQEMMTEAEYQQRIVKNLSV